MNFLKSDFLEIWWKIGSEGFITKTLVKFVKKSEFGDNQEHRFLKKTGILAKFMGK